MADNYLAPKRTLEGNFAANPRVFAHHAINLCPNGTLVSGQILLTDNPSRGACLYVGAPMSQISVTMESGAEVKFNAVSAGTFLPILVKEVTNIVVPSGSTLADSDLLALF